MTQKYDTIHELKILDDLINGVVDKADQLMRSRGTGMSSITRNSKDLVLTFPVFVSNTIDSKTMMLIAKALEAKYATTLLILFNSFNDLSDTTVQQYIKKFHINMGSEIGEQAMLMKFNESMTEYIKKNNPRFVAELAQHKKNIMEDMKNINYVLPESLAECDISGVPFDESVILEKVIKSKNREKIDRDLYNQATNQIKEANKKIDELIRYKKDYQTREARLNRELEKAKQAADGSKAKDKAIQNLSDHLDKVQHDKQKLEKDLEDTVIKRDKYEEALKSKKVGIRQTGKKINADIELAKRKDKRDQELHDRRMNQKYYGNAELTNGDIKKANDLAPALITINYYPNKNSETPRSLMLGVKAKVYPIDSETIVEKLAGADRNRGILNLIRATTREISFVKDFLLTIDTIQKDAMRAARNKDSMREWKKLESRARLVKINNLTGMNLAQAISSMVITKYEVDQIADRYDINLMDPSVLRYIMRKYSLLGIVIADPEYEIVDMMFDGDDMIEQTTNQDLAYRNKNSNDDIVNLIGKLV